MTDYRESVERLAQQAEQDGLQGVQDICLLLLEILDDPSFALDAARAAQLDLWLSLSERYRQAPHATVPDIMVFLRDPVLAWPLSEDDLAVLETLLREDAGPLVSHPAWQVADYASEIERLAAQAELDNHQGLHDACLLLLEALAAPDLNLTPERVAWLEHWPHLVVAYRRTPLAAAPQLIDYLRHPALGLALADDDVALLERLLAEDAVPPLDPNSLDRNDLAHLPSMARELVELLFMQVCAIDAELHGMARLDPAAYDLEHARQRLGYLGNAAATAGFRGLARLCEHCDINLEHFLAHTPPLTPARLALLRGWLARVGAYVPKFAIPDAGREVIAYLQDPAWPVPLSADAAATISERMRSEANSGWEVEPTPTRPTTATAADVSLAPPEDVNRELLDILLQELPLHTRQFAEAAQRLGTSGQLHDLETAQRLAHTLKGSANTVGIVGVAQLTHHLEDILSACAKAGRLPGAALAQTLLNAADCLEAMGEALLGQAAAPREALAVLQEVLDWANRIDREGLPATDAPAPEPTAPAADTASPDLTPAASVRVPTTWIEHLARLSGESIVFTAQAQDQLRRAQSQLQTLRAQFALLQNLGAELEELIDIRDWSGSGVAAGGQDFDALEMDQYHELHTASRRLVEAAVDAREMGVDIGKELDALHEVLGQQERLALDAQDAVMRTRLVEVASLLPRLQRSLRQTCRLTGKQAELSLSGGSLLLDGDTLDALADPLMHILRNAVDHGLENADERPALGKPAQGRIDLSFEREGGEVVVRCRDDGRGLDFAAIRAAAVRRGVLDAEADTSEQALVNLILRPNFSTREHTTQTSGRGVGMDAVYARVIALGGSLNLESQAGQGLTVTLRVPLPLSRSLALLAQVGGYRVAIANKGLEQIFHDSAGAVTATGALRIGDVEYPVVTLRELLRMPAAPRDHGAILLVRSPDGLTAVRVDAILESRDVVVQPLGPYLGKLPGMIGATTLGDGGVVPVVDLPELLRLPTHAAAWIDDHALEPAASTLPLALVVDDSLSNRRALEQLLTDVGYRVRTARDGMEAVERLAEAVPDIVLTDLEMPRMNGIELAGHIRARPDYGRLPIVMITSRTTQRHRKLAETVGIDAYLTKPVRDDDLLDRMRSLLNRPVATAKDAGETVFTASA